MSLYCEKCHKTFATETNLYKHLLTHKENVDEPSERKRSKKKSVVCKECSKIFCKKSDLKSHMSEHRINSQETDVPKKERKGEPANLITSTRISKQEISQENKLPPRRRRPSKLTTSACLDCDKVFYRRCDLRLHRKMEHANRKYKCNVCKRSFSDKKCFKMHYQFHNIGGAFECVYCEKSFNKGWKLKIHLVSHNGKTPYFCQLCGEDFIYPGKLREHLKCEHDLYFACQNCGIAFRSVTELEYHVCFMYSCKDCDKSFNIRDDLVSHIEIHKIDSSIVKQEMSLAASTCLLPSSVKPVSGLAVEAGTLIPATSSAVVRKVSDGGFCSESLQSSDAVPDKDVEDFSLKQGTNCNPPLFTKKRYQILPTVPKIAEDFEDQTCVNSVLIKSETDDSFIRCNSTDVKLESDETSDAELSSKLNTPMNEMDGRVDRTDSVPGLTSGKHFVTVVEKHPRYSNGEDLKGDNVDSFIDSCSVDKPKPLSLKTWLTSDNSPCLTKDFVFGRGLNDPKNSAMTIKSEVKLDNDYSMSFEALC